MTLIVATILAATLHRDPLLVRKVYEAQSFDRVQTVAVVEYESWFYPSALRLVRDKKGKVIGTAFGLFQLVDLWHNQHRGDLDAHITEGAAFLAWCWVKANGDPRKTLLLYNGGEDGYFAGVQKVYQKLGSTLLLESRYGGNL